MVQKDSLGVRVNASGEWEQFGFFPKGHGSHWGVRGRQLVGRDGACRVETRRSGGRCRCADERLTWTT